MAREACRLITEAVRLARGDESESMFFIVSGEIEVEMQLNPIRMKKGGVLR